MRYMTVAEFSEKWGISLRQVQRLLAENRIPGAQKHGRAWMIPADAAKPADPRREKNPHQSALSADLTRLIEFSSAPLPARNPDAILDSVKEERARRQYQGELAYLRGDFAGMLRCFYQAEGDDAARLRACTGAIAAAISMGDYQAYRQIEAYLKQCIKDYPGGNITVMAELALATAAVSCIAPNMAPAWLQEGDFNLLPLPVKPFAMYLRAKYFQCLRQDEAMLAVAQTALVLSEPEHGISQTGIYLRISCAMACQALGRENEARRYLLEAMHIAFPHGFITPFSEVVTAMGGLMEQCLVSEFPASADAVLGQWKRAFVNWLTFHNQFTKDNITLILTLREYHIALQIARRVPYAQVARQHNVSVGRLGNIVQEIYGKLYVTDRDELAKYIL